MLTDKAMGLATPIILDEGISKAFEVILAEFPESEEVKTGTEATGFYRAVKFSDNSIITTVPNGNGGLKLKKVYPSGY
ncbi:hypothetical protein DET61_116126 [Marinobacter nauticus]|jgi:hypothetical protein|uniref:Uncharacterized protein n=1 Tax=Marinobacter nauticus TaxID=2743 RepID=A0A368X8B7_MARNT|nr:hypothetical protein [Marinobacter nauticus]RCW64085.1 hypothetical protein DET61_116126 [Marinobacter nauticus]